MRRPPSEPRRIRSGEAGFSLLETLIAAAVLLMILIGLLPLFERSRLNLMQGNDATRVSNATIENAERLLALPFNGLMSNLPDGAFTLETEDFWLLNGDTWAAAVPAGDSAQYTRRTIIDQFGVSDASDNDDPILFPPHQEGVAGGQLPGGTPPGQVHYKRIITVIRNPRLEGTFGDAENPAAGPGIYRIVSVQTY